MCVSAFFLNSLFFVLYIVKGLKIVKLRLCCKNLLFNNLTKFLWNHFSHVLPSIWIRWKPLVRQLTDPGCVSRADKNTRAPLIRHTLLRMEERPRHPTYCWVLGRIVRPKSCKSRTKDCPSPWQLAADQLRIVLKWDWGEILSPEWEDAIKGRGCTYQLRWKRGSVPVLADKRKCRERLRRCKRRRTMTPSPEKCLK